MIFRQLLEPASSTYTYLLGCEETGKAVLIDPVISAVERDLAELSRLELTLAYSLDTHIHADHITAGLELKKRTGSRIASPAFDALPCTDVGIEENKAFQVGNLRFEPLQERCRRSISVLSVHFLLQFVWLHLLLLCHLQKQSLHLLLHLNLA